MDFEQPKTEPSPEEKKPDVKKEEPASRPEAKKWTEEEEAEIKELHRQRYAQRWTDHSLDKEVDAMIEAAGLKPMTPEADRFMQKKDREWAEAKFLGQKERKEGANLFTRLVETFALVAGHGNLEKSKEALKQVMGAVKEISLEEKITKDNIGDLLGKMLERLPPDALPWMKDYKEGEGKKTLQEFIKDVTETIKIDKAEERKQKIGEVLDKYEIKGTFRSDIETLLEGAKKLTEASEVGQQEQDEAKKLEEMQGRTRGVMDKIWSTLGIIGAAGLMLLLFGIIAMLWAADRLIKKGGRK